MDVYTELTQDKAAMEYEMLTRAEAAPTLRAMLADYLLLRDRIRAACPS